MDSMYDVLLQLPLFQGVSRVKMSEIIEKTRFHFLKYQDNEIIARRGEECTHMKFIVSGSARAELKNINGKIRVTETLHAPNILYPNHLFGRNTTYPSEVTAKENCGIMQIDKQAFVTLIQQSPIFIINLTLTIRSNLDRTVPASVFGLAPLAVETDSMNGIEEDSFAGGSLILVRMIGEEEKQQLMELLNR